MLSTIKLSNFKCFRELDINCTALNLLCGLNGMGKSSVIQSLLLLRQSFTIGELQQGRLVINGDLVELGTGGDILFEDAADDLIRFELQGYGIPPWVGSFDCAWDTASDYSPTTDQLRAQSAPGSGSTPYAPDPWQQLPPFDGSVLYINAERIGPRKVHERSETFARRGILGSRAEYAMNYLNNHQHDKLPEGDRRCLDPNKRGLLAVANRWLQEITPGAEIDFAEITKADALIAGFSFERRGDTRSRSYRATNVGFGLSYALPVIVAMLAPKNTLCLIENPEAHLHPQGQTRLAELAARAASAGVQIITETHSDHFMDGVRIAVRNGQIQPQQASFHYFASDGPNTIVTSPQVDTDGRLSSWPPGFFDQYDENLAKLLAPKA